MRRLLPRLASFLAALVVTAALLYGCAAGVGPLPAPGPTFAAGQGVWDMARGAVTTSETLRIWGLEMPVQVTIDAEGVPHIQARTDEDMFIAMGYLEARDRLFEMDLFRRSAEGGLSQILGPSELGSDELNLSLGLLRTAQQEWREMAPDSSARLAVQYFTEGVNDRISDDEADGTLPLGFSLLGYRPAAWQPVDSLVLRGLLAEDLAYQEGPLQAALLQNSLGSALTQSWFPQLPPNAQVPYDPGPYTTRTLAEPVADAETALSQALTKLDGIGLDGALGASNNWAVNGPRAADGKALMANDPHLALSLPSIWYQVDLESPDYHVAGVGLPGAPLVLIGRNRDISWGATDTEAQATVYYRDQTDPGHPGEYEWKGAWHQFRLLHYDIPVKGQAAKSYTVRLSAQGPVLTQQGETLAVDWVADSPAPQTFGDILAVMRAGDWSSFTAALRTWVGPIQNWVYADDQGNIGIIAPGDYPIVASGNPAYPLPGDGSADVIGRIPFSQVPRVYDPPDHMVVSANQRPVGPAYPYDIGSTLGTFDPGYRAGEITSQIQQAGPLTVAGMERIQMDARDGLAVRLLPSLRSALAAAPMQGDAAAARGLMASWDGEMTTASPAAAIWSTFVNQYVSTVFQPWWRSRDVKPSIDQVSDPLTEDLESWTLHDPGNPAFTPPGGAHRTAPQAMVDAFQKAVSQLSTKLGGAPRTWKYGRVHSRLIPSLLGLSALGYGPVSSPGDADSPLAAPGAVSEHGPSWRIVVDWSTGQSYGIYPGGQSENPASSDYDDQVGDWFDGRLRPMRWAGSAQRQPGSVTWQLVP
ncbi:MAG TPA: penicillin acylase family protein [Candidatus Dormibacteraeota bacterium]|nr:penicillin acylase family protein [Candidatus Dormibacteraeota bacterium]